MCHAANGTAMKLARSARKMNVHTSELPRSTVGQRRFGRGQRWNTQKPEAMRRNPSKLPVRSLWPCARDVRVEG